MPHFIQILELLWYFMPYLLLLAFIVLEIVCISKTGADAFILIARKIQRSCQSSIGLTYVATPVRFQAMVMNETLKEGTLVSVVDQLPLIPNYDKIQMTSNETKIPAGSTVFLHSIKGRNLVLKTQPSSSYSLSQ